MKRTPALLLALFMLFGASCGGGEDRLSEDEFTTQGNDICREGNDKIEAAAEKAFGNQTQQPPAAEVERFVDEEFIPNIEGQLSDLRDLEPPEEMEDDVDQWLNDADKALDEARDLEGSEILNTETDPFEDVNEQANDLGLDACGE